MDEKRALLGLPKEAACGPTNWMERYTQPAAPLWWQESKSVDLWKALIANYRITQIVDLCGISALGTAALHKRVPYVAVCLSKNHSNWLQNIIDREAIKCVCDQQHPLWQQALSELLKDYFADVFEQSAEGEQLNEADATLLNEGQEGVAV